MSRLQPVIVCDVDEVVLAMLPEWVRIYNMIWQDDLTMEEITDWDLTRFVKPECGTQIYDILNAPDLYKHVRPIVGALEGITVLREMGCRVLFVTSATKGHAGQKLQALQDHGFLPAGRQTDRDYLEVTDKSLVRGDLMIDDRPSNLESFPGIGLLFPVQHNALWVPPVGGKITRVWSWAEIPQAVADALSLPDSAWDAIARNIGAIPQVLRS